MDVKCGFVLHVFLQNHQCQAKEAQELLSAGKLKRTHHRSSRSIGYACYSVESTSLQITPALFLPDELCSCLPGFQGKGASCAQCPINTFSSGYDNSTCRPCPTGSTANVGEATCHCKSGGAFYSDQTPSCQCASGYAAGSLDKPNNSDGENEVCLPCHTAHLVCSKRGMLLSFAPPAAGFARLSSNDTAARPCLPPKETRCNSTGSNGSTFSECASGYQGVLCSDCAAQYYLSNKLCEACPSEDLTWQVWQIVAALAAGAVIVGLVLACFRMLRTSEFDETAVFSRMGALKEQLKQQAPMLLQTCQLWAVLAVLMNGERKPGAPVASSWEIPFIEA